MSEAMGRTGGMAEKRYYPEMDRLRGAAILMVLLYHSVLVYPIDLTTRAFGGTLHSLLWTVEMPLFFLVSGFCFRYDGGYPSYLKKKSLRILVPHFVFGGVDLALRMIPNTLVHESFNAGQALREFFLYGANDWFLWTLFVIFLAAPLLERICSRGRAGSALVLAASLILYLLQNKIPYLLCLRNVVQFLIFFVFGMLWRNRRENRRENRKGILWKAPLAAVLGTAGFLLLPWKGFTGDEQIWEQALNGMLKPLREPLIVQVLPGITWLKICYLLVNLAAPLLLCYVVYIAACLIKEGRLHRFLAFCSRYSLQMYLLDGYALVLTRTLLVTVLGITRAEVIIFGNFVLDTAIVLLISKYLLDKWEVLRVLSGLNRRK